MEKRATVRVDRRSRTLAGRIRRAQRAIENEVAQNDGRYPMNDGRLTEAEVCRRAGIRLDSLQSAPGAAARRELSAWVARMTGDGECDTARMTGDGETDIARVSEIARRSEARREQLAQIADSYQRANVEFDTLRKRVKRLERRSDAVAERFANLSRTAGGKRGRGNSR